METEKKLTGYPSIDKPWLKYYSEEAIKAPLPECTIYEYLYENNKKHLNDVALIYFGRKITYKTLFKNIDKTASAFINMGIGKGDIVTVQSISLPQIIYIIYALSKVGAVANLIYATSTPKEVADNLTQTKSKLYFVIDSIFAKFNTKITTPYLKNIILLSVADEMPVLLKAGYSIKNKNTNYDDETLAWKLFLNHANKCPIPVTGCCSDTVIMIYTGGTTGVSKGVMLSNNNLNISTLQCSYYGIERQSRFLSVLPPFIAFGVALAIHMPLTLGTKTIMGVSANLSEIGGFVTKYKPNYLICGTMQAEKMLTSLKNQKLHLSFLKWLVVGGDCLSNKLENELNEWLSSNNSTIKVTQGYAMSETSATAAISVYTPTKKILKKGTVGIPLAYTNVKIVDNDTNQEVSYGKQGEICINTPCMMIGYYENEEETNYILRKHNDGKVWVHTGDIGYIDEEGFITIAGRIKRMILVLDNDVCHKVFPKILEEKFLKTGVIKAISIVGRENKDIFNDLIAFVTLESKTTEEDAIKALTQYAIEKLESYERPIKYIVKDKLPVTTIGKIDYRALEKMAEEQMKGN